MKLQVNGNSMDVSSSGLLDLLRSVGIDPESRGVAVAVNGAVVSRSGWEDLTLGEGDDVEIITAMQGG